MNNTTGLLALLLKYKNGVLILAILALFFLVITKLVVPTMSSVFETKQAIAVDETRLTKLTQKENFLKGLKKTTLALEEQKLDVAIPFTINLPSVLATIQKVASESDVTLGEFSIFSKAAIVTILPIENTQALSSFRFKANLTGSLENMARFIEKLGSSSPIIHVESLNYTDGRATAVFIFYFEPKSAKQFAADDVLLPISEGTKEALDEVLGLTPPVLQ